MYYFFYGDNTYLLKEKLEELKERFKKTDSSGINISQLDGVNLTLDTFWSDILSAPFLADKRLVIIKNLLLENKNGDLQKSIAKDLTKIPDCCVVIFAEFGSPDARTALFKALNQPKKSHKFEALIGSKLDNWIETKFLENNSSITTEAKNKLNSYTNGDLWRLQNEIEKLLLFKKSSNKSLVEASDIDLLVKAEANANIFDFIDAVASKNSKKAISVLQNLIAAGENELYIFSMIVYQYRTMLIIADLSRQKLSPAAISKETKIHPFVVNKTKNLLSKYTEDLLTSVYLELRSTDLEIKQGRVEPGLSILTLTLRLCQAKTT